MLKEPKHVRVGWDAHVVDGKFQGSRTVLMRLIEEIMLLPDDDADASVEHLVYSNALSGRGGSFRSLPKGSAMGRLLSFFPKARTRDRLDVVVFQYICSPFVPSIVFIHDILPITNPELFPFLFRVRSAFLFVFSMSLARKVVVVSEFSKAAVERSLPKFSAKLKVVKNGPSFPVAEYFRDNKDKINSDQRYILCVGRIERRKNVAQLLSAFVKANVEGVELILVGKRDLGYEIDLDIDGVRVIEDASDQDLINLYKKASLFVYPSLAEGFGLPLLDAVLFGVPTIASNKTAMPEVGGDLATYFDPSAPDAIEVLAHMIRLQFSDGAVRPPSIDQRRRHAEKFSWSSAAASFQGAVIEL